MPEGRAAAPPESDGFREREHPKHPNENGAARHLQACGPAAIQVMRAAA